MPKVKKSSQHLHDSSRDFPEIPEDQKYRKVAAAIREKEKELDSLVHICMLKTARMVFEASSSSFEQDDELEALRTHLKSGLQSKNLIEIGRGIREYPPYNRLGDYDLKSDTPEVKFVVALHDLYSSIEFWSMHDNHGAHEDTVRCRSALKSFPLVTR